MKKEDEPMPTQNWYDNLIRIASELDTNRRYSDLVQLHQETLDFYLPTVQSLTDEDAYRRSSDGRYVALVVAHIMAWEDWQVQVFTDADRTKRLQEQMQLRGYHDIEGRKTVDFTNVDDFNAYQSKKYAQWQWADIKQKAVNTALALQSLFPERSSQDWTDFLNNTPVHNWKILPDKTLSTPSGWDLWMVSLEHEAVEHRKDLLKK